MKRILIIIFLTAIVTMAVQLYGAYRVYKMSNIRFLDFNDIKNIFEQDKKITVKIDNPTRRKIFIKNMNITIEKNGVYRGSFAPLDLEIREGQNNVVLTFANNTRYLLIATDYITSQLSGYDLVIRGLWNGFIPFRIRIKLSNII